MQLQEQNLSKTWRKVNIDTKSKTIEIISEVDCECDSATGRRARCQIVRPSVRPSSAMSPGPVFVALVNPKSGGNVGSTLLARFRDILDGGRVYNLAEEGPKRALEEHWGKPNLRIIGK